ncbi:MAG TPA: hypothetical protein VK852_08825 [Desulfobacterales bacterium]|jgi:aspartate/glutamate racemase|nr:hypothetical protein [Desulfobacterales bacterium]
MKTIGMIGGMSWESSAEYYRVLNPGIGLLVSQADTAAPLFDTARIHAEAAVDFAIDGPSGG